MTQFSAATEERAKVRAAQWAWNGRRVFYQESGDPARAAVVFVHGHATSHFTWRHQAAAFDDQCRVLIPDLLGFGKSEKPREVIYSVDLWTEQIAAFIRDVAGGNAVVAGNSLGGLIAAHVADRFPKLVRGLVLIAAAGASSRLQSSLVNFPFLLMRAPLFGRALFDITVQKRFVEWNVRHRLYANPDVATPEVMNHYRECFFAEENREIVFEVTKAFGDFIMSDDMSRRITQPTLLLWGERDTFVPPMRGRQLLRVMPQAELEIVAAAAHCPHEDRPAEVNARLRAFFKKVLAAD
jgi:pimeloyl-ACP methyl ester carboxylesterase